MQETLLSQQDRMCLFENFNFSLLEDENFKEDSVREEILIPIFNKLGFKAYMCRF